MDRSSPRHFSHADLTSTVRVSNATYMKNGEMLMRHVCLLISILDFALLIPACNDRRSQTITFKSLNSESRAENYLKEKLHSWEGEMS